MMTDKTQRVRSFDEIIARYKDRAPMDIMGFEAPEYLEALTLEELNSLKGDIIDPGAELPEDFNPNLYSYNQVLRQAKDYMDFAWRKANNKRGISANRSIMHYIAWLWLLGEDQFDNLMDDYEFYGKPQLIRICQFLEIDYKQYDDGVRENF